MSEVLWKVCVINGHGHTFYVLGLERDLRPIYEDWRDATEYNATAKIELVGFEDDAVRTPLFMTFDREKIENMILTRHSP